MCYLNQAKIKSQDTSREAPDWVFAMAIMYIKPELFVFWISTSLMNSFLSWVVLFQQHLVLTSVCMRISMIWRRCLCSFQDGSPRACWCNTLHATKRTYTSRVPPMISLSTTYLAGYLSAFTSSDSVVGPVNQRLKLETLMLNLLSFGIRRGFTTMIFTSDKDNKNTWIWWVMPAESCLVFQSLST